MKSGGVVAIILTILIVCLVIAGLLLQAMGKVDFVKKCRKKPPTEIELEQIAEQETLRAAMEESILRFEVKAKVDDKIIHQGQNDSFFAGEELVNQEEINPNISMGYQKFKFDANPEFLDQKNWENASQASDLVEKHHKSQTSKTASGQQSNETESSFQGSDRN